VLIITSEMVTAAITALSDHLIVFPLNNEHGVVEWYVRDVTSSMVFTIMAGPFDTKDKAQAILKRINVRIMLEAAGRKHGEFDRC
jgi:hypothetical protein